MAFTTEPKFAAASPGDGHDPSTEVFREEYAGAYDAIYADKNYAAECDAIERLFNEFGRTRIRRLLDAGCGTGGHALILAARGYEVTGVDVSEAMLDRARFKSVLAAGDRRPRWVRSDLRRLDLGERFDAVIMMFAVLGYQTADKDVRATLSSLRRHLEPGGILIFDVWHAPAVLAQKPAPKTRVFMRGHQRLQRDTAASLDPCREVCHVQFTLKDLTRHGAFVAEESHFMRYFSRSQVDAFLRESGFETVGFGCMDDPRREPTEADWTMLVTARAR